MRLPPGDDEVTIPPELRRSERGRFRKDRSRFGHIGVIGIVLVIGLLGWLVRSTEGVRPELGSPSIVSVTSTVVPRLAGPPALDPPRIATDSAAPLDEVVPGFDDTITALTWGNRGVDILRWESSDQGPETVVSLTHGDGGWNRSVDASGAWLVEMSLHAGLTVRSLANHEGSSLGGRQVADAAGERTWSPTWHDAQPGWIAWLSCSDEPAAPVVLSSIDVGDPAAGRRTLPLDEYQCADARLWLTRWGDWGALLQRADGSRTTHVLIDAAGNEVAVGRIGPEGEWFVGAGPEGTTIWTEGLRRAGSSSFVLSPDGRDRTAVPGLTGGERLEAALPSPDGSLLALVPDLEANFGSAVRVVAADTGAVVVEFDEPEAWVTRMVWSTDSRFLIYERWPDVKANWAGVPQDVELVFYDTEADTAVALPLPGYAPALRTGA